MSTGPTTEAGKAKSSQNAVRHGLTGRLMIVQGENGQEYLDLINGLMAEHKPATGTETSLVVRMGQSLWMAQRALTRQSMLFVESPEPDQKLMALYLRYQTTHDRAFSRSLADLLKFRADRRREQETAPRQQREFVSQNQKLELHQAKLRTLNFKFEVMERKNQVREFMESPLPAVKTA